MNSQVLLNLFLETFILGSPLILAALGGYFSERSGVVNIALEGKMLMAACASTVVVINTQSPWLSLGAGIFAATVFSLVHWLMTQVYRIDAVVSGMAINAIALGGSNFMNSKMIDPQYSGPMPFFWDNALRAIALTMPVLVWAYSRWTRSGLRMMAVGSDPDKARTMGVNPLWVRCSALVGTGVFCGLSGTLIASNAGSFQDNMTAGRGYIALAALILGGWRPIPTALACLVFGMFQAMEITLQGTIKIPSQAWNCLPYLVAIIAIAGFAAKNRAPAGTGKL